MRKPLTEEELLRYDPRAERSKLLRAGDPGTTFYVLEDTASLAQDQSGNLMEFETFEQGRQYLLRGANPAFPDYVSSIKEAGPGTMINVGKKHWYVLMEVVRGSGRD